MVKSENALDLGALLPWDFRVGEGENKICFIKRIIWRQIFKNVCSAK